VRARATGKLTRLCSTARLGRPAQDPLINAAKFGGTTQKRALKATTKEPRNPQPLLDLNCIRRGSSHVPQLKRSDNGFHHIESDESLYVPVPTNLPYKLTNTPQQRRSQSRNCPRTSRSQTRLPYKMSRKYLPSRPAARIPTAWESLTLRRRSS
jgi:hypothetical protein